MAILWALFLGAFIGWLNSLAVRSDTNERILIDILVGALGAVALAMAVGNNSVFDSLVAGFLGSCVGLGLLYLIRRGLTQRAR